MSLFIKIDAAGNHLDASAPDADVVAMLDPATGLMWLARDLSERRVTHDKAEAEVAACTTLGLTWRLPTVPELFSHVDRSRLNPAVNPNGLPNIKSDWYWTSEKLASSSVCAWIVAFGYGDVSYLNRNDNAFVRAVSGPSPAGQ